MRRTWSTAIGGILGLWGLGLWGAEARAEESEPIRIVYTAPDDCPTREAFVAELQARTARAEVVEEGERRSFEVKVTTSDAGRVRGSLTVRGGTRIVTRELEGQTCSEVVSGLALVTALTIDPRASTKAAAELVPPEPPPASPPLPPDAPPEPPPAAPPPTPVRDAPPSEAESTAARASRWELAAGPESHVRTGTLPSGALAVGGVIVITLRTPSWLSPQLRLSGSAAVSGQTQGVADAAVTLHWASARGQICPIRVDVVQSLSLRPCGLTELGGVSARGEGLAEAEQRSRSWVAAGGSVVATWERERFFVTGELSLFAPLRRDRFFAVPRTTLYEVPAIGLVVGLSMGFVFLSS